VLVTNFKSQTAGRRLNRGQPIKKKYDSFRVMGRHRISILGPIVSYAIDHDCRLTCNSVLGEGEWLAKPQERDIVRCSGERRSSSRAYSHKICLAVMIWLFGFFFPGTEPFDIILQHTKSQKKSIRIFVVKAY